MHREPNDLYPPIEPYGSGMLEVGDGNLVYWEVCGNPDGKPALVVHGGPGSGSTPRSRQYFDPDRYRVVLFDQRGCGRSTPHASDPAADMAHNTTAHLIADMERLREHLAVDKWLLYGGSWGSTLILAYAEEHPERVTEIVIPSVTTTRRSEIDWLYRGVGQLFPEAWDAFRAGVPETSDPAGLVAAYARRMESEDASVREKATADWCAWEDAVVSMEAAGARPRTAAAPAATNWPSSESAPTTSPTEPGWRKANSSPARTAWPVSLPYWSTAASTSRAPSRPPGNSTAPGPTPA